MNTNKSYSIRITPVFTFILLISISIFIFVSDYFSLFYNKNSLEENKTYSKTGAIDFKTETYPQINANNFNILVIADSHLNKDVFPILKNLSNKYNVSLVVHLGDHTDFGSDNELKEAKNLLDSVEKNYIALPGDRDLAASGDSSNFYKYFTFTYDLSFKDLKLLFVNNSANFTLLNETYLDSIIKRIPDSNIIFLSQPIYVEKGNIFENKYMGSLNAFNFSDEKSINRQHEYLKQRNKILNSIRSSKNKLVVAGDHHRSSKFVDPENNSIEYLINGATAENLNSNGITIKQKNFQSQRISIISVQDNLKYSIYEIEIYEK